MSERVIRGESRESPSGLVTGLVEKFAQLEQAVARQAERFTAILEIGTQISSVRDVDQLLQLVMDRLSALVNAEAATLFMIDERNSQLWSKVLKGSSLKEIRIPINAGLAGHVVTSGKTVMLADAYSDIRFNPEIDRLSGFRTRSLIAAPLRHVSGRILGAVEVLHRKVDHFSVEDRNLVEGIAHQIAAVLDNVQLVEQLKTKAEKLTAAREELSASLKDLDALYEIEKAISEAAGRDDLVDTILLRTMALLGAGAGSVLLNEEDEDSLHFRAAKGEKAESLSSMKMSAGQGIAGHVAATGESVRVTRAEDSEHYDKTIAKKLGVQIGAVLCVPINVGNATIGSLELLNKKGGFDETDERLATLLAAQSGRAIQAQKSRAEGERKARLAAIGQMLSSVIHDVRTPMTVISGYADLIADEANVADRKQMAEVIHQQLEHLKAMTAETLAFAKGESNVLLKKIYLQNFVKELTPLLEQTFKGTKIELEIDATYTGTARFDENKIKRVIFNIARNAIEAMPKGGHFALGIARDGKQVVFTFADDGPGIPPEIADKLFGSFVTARKKNGTGLGLAIVKKIAEEHEGTVTCQSKPGKGTTFELRIPARTD